MKKIIPFIFYFLNSLAYSQQWDWAVTADSVFGNQETKMICKSNSDLYLLIYQHGSSIIKNTYLDSGSVIVKINTNGKIIWAKQFPGIIQSLCAGNNGTIYFIGLFSDTLNFPDTTLISHGSNDVFYGQLDPAGNKLWISSAGGFQDDAANAIITDEQSNIFITVHIKDDYYVGNQLLMGNSGYYTFLLRCNLIGNFIEAQKESLYTMGLALKKAMSGTIYFSTYYNYNEYSAGCQSIYKINPLNFTTEVITGFGQYESLLGWSINSDLSLTAIYNTGGHYYSQFDLFNIFPNNQYFFRKTLGYEYDGKYMPLLAKGIYPEIIVGGGFGRSNYPDTVWFDNFFVIPDTLPNVIIGGINSTEQFTWLLRSEGKGESRMKSLISDELGHCYSAGNYNMHVACYYHDSLPEPVSFGTPFCLQKITLQGFLWLARKLP